MTKQEWLAHKHLAAALKFTQGRSDLAAQQEAKLRPGVRWAMSDDPEVIRLTSNGYEAFVEQTTKRILAEHADEVVLNRCPKCGALARTPKARQCRYCKHDWHDRH
jgi:hypothetical protein